MKTESTLKMKSVHGQSQLAAQVIPTLYDFSLLGIKNGAGTCCFPGPKGIFETTGTDIRILSMTYHWFNGSQNSALELQEV
jgi:hypothetical protein